MANRQMRQLTSHSFIKQDSPVLLINLRFKLINVHSPSA
uniref:Uncharacterized protein n=1 Tax=Anguilla anguilla TaxID=7936 RepID=A0A0E9W0L8_ANGAN